MQARLYSTRHTDLSTCLLYVGQLNCNTSLSWLRFRRLCLCRYRDVLEPANCVTRFQFSKSRPTNPKHRIVDFYKRKRQIDQQPGHAMELQHPFALRDLQKSDFHKGYLQLLEQLTKVGNISEEEFTSRLEQVQNAGDHYKIAVIEDLDRQLIVATATLLMEFKFVRNCGKVGHIEDVVVDQSTRGQHLGQRVVECLTKKAKDLGCYKVILDCSKENAPFYEKCGFYQKELQMAHYF